MQARKQTKGSWEVLFTTPCHSSLARLGFVFAAHTQEVVRLASEKRSGFQWRKYSGLAVFSGCKASAEGAALAA